jgi:hypothetical protein
LAAARGNDHYKGWNTEVRIPLNSDVEYTVE